MLLWILDDLQVDAYKWKHVLHVGKFTKNIFAFSKTTLRSAGIETENAYKHLVLSLEVVGDMCESVYLYILLLLSNMKENMKENNFKNVVIKKETWSR